MLVVDNLVTIHQVDSLVDVVVDTAVGVLEAVGHLDRRRGDFAVGIASRRWVCPAVVRRFVPAFLFDGTHFLVVEAVEPFEQRGERGFHTVGVGVLGLGDRSAALTEFRAVAYRDDVVIPLDRKSVV